MGHGWGHGRPEHPSRQDIGRDRLVAAILARDIVLRQTVHLDGRPSAYHAVIGGEEELEVRRVEEVLVLVEAGVPLTFVCGA